jgi:hypothetical protein
MARTGEGNKDNAMGLRDPSGLGGPALLAEEESCRGKPPEFNRGWRTVLEIAARKQRNRICSQAALNSYFGSRNSGFGFGSGFH